PAMQLVPQALGRALSRAVAALPCTEGYMNRRFLLGQLSHGFGAAVARQSFLWMAPMAPGRLAALWRGPALAARAGPAALAAIDRAAAEAEDLAPVDLLLYLFMVTYLPEDILTKTDRASMFNSLEVRAPFLDRRFAECAMSLPRGLKLRRHTKKYILKRL